MSWICGFGELQDHYWEAGVAASDFILIRNVNGPTFWGKLNWCHHITEEDTWSQGWPSYHIHITEVIRGRGGGQWLYLNGSWTVCYKTTVETWVTRTTIWTFFHSQVFRTFLSGEKWTTSVYESSENPELPFPTVILCNFNRLSWEKTQKYNLSLDIIGYLFQEFEVEYTVPRPPVKSETVEEYKV